jgi:cytosine deaminase
VVIGEATNFVGGHEWVAEHGVHVVLLEDTECIELLGAFIAEHPGTWHGDIGR